MVVKIHWIVAALLLNSGRLGFAGQVPKTNQPFRTYRSLPSVSNDHYQELASDGTYRYAYTGVNTYHAEKRLPDGTVEGETVVVRPDGFPVKVHYFADNFGYRPQTEVLVAERIISQPQRKSRVLVPDVVYKEVDIDHGTAEVAHHPQEPTVLLAPPPPVPVPIGLPRGDGSINVKLDGSKISIGGRSLPSGDVAAASPSISAIVGPGAHVELRPDTVARSGHGGTALSSPTINAVIAPGASAVVAPSSRASNDADNVQHVLVPPSQTVATRTSRLYEPPQHPAAPVIHLSTQPLPTKPKVHVLHSAPVAVAPPPPPAIVVPPNSKYSYTYSYSAPDGKHPHRDNSAFVAVNVNH